jgi:hypothetical protein
LWTRIHRDSNLNGYWGYIIRDETAKRTICGGFLIKQGSLGIELVHGRAFEITDGDSPNEDNELWRWKGRAAEYVPPELFFIYEAAPASPKSEYSNYHFKGLIIAHGDEDPPRVMKGENYELPISNGSDSGEMKQIKGCKNSEQAARIMFEENKERLLKRGWITRCGDKHEQKTKPKRKRR